MSTKRHNLFDLAMSSSSKKEATAGPAAPKSLDAEITKYKVCGCRCSHLDAESTCLTSFQPQTAADIIHNVMKKLVERVVEGANVFDLVVEGDKHIEAGAAAVYNKKTKTGFVPKGKVHIRRTKRIFVG
jgi:hypothetical protein